MVQPENATDQPWMSLALELAAKGIGSVEPNPMVGCVLVKDGQLIGQGYHHRYGGPHAEIDALESLSNRDDAAGATAYVTLEPCCHHGKTPPCSQALIRAKVGRVVVAMRDPFEQVDGGGIVQLREAGIQVDVGLMNESANELNAAYLKRIRTGLPWVIAKWAMTMDGRIATHAGHSQWITGSTSRHHVHLLRRRVDAILTGMGTVLADDPMLNARVSVPATDGPGRIAIRTVLCRNQLPPTDCKLIQTARAIPTWIVAPSRFEGEPTQPLIDYGAKVVLLPTNDPTEMVRLALVELGRERCTNVMIEAGPTLLGSFIDVENNDCLIDECHVFVGAKLFGGHASPGPVGGTGIALLTEAFGFELQSIDRFDDDVRLIYRRRS